MLAPKWQRDLQGGSQFAQPEYAAGLTLRPAALNPACAPTPDMSRRRANRRKGPNPENLGALTAFPVYPRWLTLGDGHVVNKPMIVVQPEINARRGDRPIIRWVSGSGAAERKRPIPPLCIEIIDEFTTKGRRFVACFVASGSSPRWPNPTLVDVVSLKAYYELLLLKTDQTPLVSARSCVAALASQASSFHVCFAPDSDRNADIAEGPSWAICRLLHRSKMLGYSITSSARRSNVGGVTP